MRDKIMKPACSVDNCGNTATRRGWCVMHYARWQRTGDPLKTKTNPGALCSVPDCGKPARKRGWCNMHHLRWKATGDPLVIKQKTAPGDALTFYHDVVLPFDGDCCLTWPHSRYRTGYGVLKVQGRNRTVSRLACQAICGPAPTAEHMAAHNCNNGHLGCVNPRHLRWATREENTADMLAAGNASRRLTVEKVREIRAKEGTATFKAIAKELGLAPTTIRKVCRRLTWKHVG